MNTRERNRNNPRNTRPSGQGSGPTTIPDNSARGVDIAAEISRSLQESLPTIIAQIQLAMNQSSM